MVIAVAGWWVVGFGPIVARVAGFGVLCCLLCALDFFDFPVGCAVGGLVGGWCFACGLVW